MHDYIITCRISAQETEISLGRITEMPFHGLSRPKLDSAQLRLQNVIPLRHSFTLLR
jgi:hypothetical protein